MECKIFGHWGPQREKELHRAEYKISSMFINCSRGCYRTPWFVSSRTIIEKFRFPFREDTNRGLRRISYLNAVLLNFLGSQFFSFGTQCGCGFWVYDLNIWPQRATVGKKSYTERNTKYHQLKCFNASLLLNAANGCFCTNCKTHSGSVLAYSRNDQPMAFWIKNSLEPAQCSMYLDKSAVSVFSR